MCPFNNIIIIIQVKLKAKKHYRLQNVVGDMVLVHFECYVWNTIFFSFRWNLYKTLSIQWDKNININKKKEIMTKTLRKKERKKKLDLHSIWDKILRNEKVATMMQMSCELWHTIIVE
jgi:hypothetical protein